MEHINNFLLMLSKLNYLQIIFFLCAISILFFGNYWIKYKYLKRTNQKYDKAIENRNSWIFFPPPYNLVEKVQLVIIYITFFILMIIFI